jgi:hypothetical protein
MAATNVSAAIARVPIDGMIRAENMTTFTGLNATSASFNLMGGQYALDVVGATFGTDFSANGSHIVNLSPGTYQLALA